MSKKRKSLATSLDEVDRTMYSTFCSAANSLSQLYSQAMSHQKLSFLSGERHGLEKLYQWISMQHGEGLRVTSDDILVYIQAELECWVEEPSMTPRSLQQQNSQATGPFTNSGSSSASVQGGGFSDQQQQQQPGRNYIFSNALSSPVRRNLQNYHISQEGCYGVVKNNNHNDQQQLNNNNNNSRINNNNNNNNNNINNRDPLWDSSSMDMHADGESS